MKKDIKKLEILKEGGWEDWSPRTDIRDVSAIRIHEVLPYAEAKEQYGDLPNFPPPPGGCPPVPEPLRKGRR